MSSLDTCQTSHTEAPKWDQATFTIGQTLQGLTDAYKIQEWKGDGSFGTVAKCMAVDSRQSVAVKILKSKNALEDMEAEVSILEELRILDPVRTSLVHFVEQFESVGFYCLAFEMLDMDLHTFLVNRKLVPLQMSEIRPIAHQLFVALYALKGLGIMHCDIKPDNVMFTDVDGQPLRVKLIDFGVAMRASEVEVGALIQAEGYRAPEVILGLPITEAIDMWAVGCVLVFLYLSGNLFPVKCGYHIVKCMVDLLGPPSDHMLETGEFSDVFFIKDRTSEAITWRLLVFFTFVVYDYYINAAEISV
ncbi:homeodomain-interacting protein kinase 2-like [Eucyclogobius newberryi]|uniref:homeodomain-interacting protein kinase 2-like n=1 Tax=Eucyclogobius newberryi TaxID=166745 RepID=UPI003B5C0E56